MLMNSNVIEGGLMILSLTNSIDIHNKIRCEM